jgi:hypothetical protein
MKIEVKRDKVSSSKEIFTSKNRQLRCLEISGTKYPVTQRHIPEERVSHSYGYENLKTGINCIYVIPGKIKWSAVVKMAFSLLIS